MQEEPQDPRIRRLREAESLLGRVNPQDWRAAEDEILRIVREHVQGTVTKHGSGKRRVELRDIIQPARIGMPQLYIEGRGWFPERTPPDEKWERQRVQEMRDRLVSFLRGVIGDLLEEDKLERYRLRLRDSTKPAPFQDPSSSWRELPGLPGLAFNESFNEVRWGDRTIPFSSSQAAILKAMFEASRTGPTDLSQHWLLEKAGLDGKRLRDYFARHELWGKLLARGSTKGTYRLSSPGDRDA